MVGTPACAGMSPAGGFGVSSRGVPHGSVTCSMSIPVSRRGLHTRHLGSKPNLGSCRSLVSVRTDRLRPAVPRQGRAMCQAARQSQVTPAITVRRFWQYAAVHHELKLACFLNTESIQTGEGDGWSSEGPGRFARGTVLWSCTASCHSCWGAWIHSWGTCARYIANLFPGINASADLNAGAVCAATHIAMQRNSLRLKAMHLQAMQHMWRTAISTFCQRCTALSAFSLLQLMRKASCSLQQSTKRLGKEQAQHLLGQLLQ